MNGEPVPGAGEGVPGTGSVVLSAEGVRRLDARLAAAGLLEVTLENAGRAVADAAQAGWPTGAVLLLAGSGANGADAWVAARHLHALGRAVQVLALPALAPLARRARRQARAAGVPQQPLTPPSLRRLLAAGPLVIDGLLGTGVRPPLRPALAELIAELNGSGAEVLSIDLPSGLEADRAAAPELAVRATRTLTLGGPKPALLYSPAAAWAGRVQVAGLRAPPGWTEAEALAARPSDAALGALLPRRGAGAHKGDAGVVWVVGGHPGTLGAPVLAARAALRTGSGLVTLYTASEDAATLAVTVAPELMARVPPELAAALAAVPADRRPDALALGMGLGPDAARLAAALLRWRRPTVLDADALQPELAGQGHDQVIWTPHPGEAGRLLGQPTAAVTADPLAAARMLQARYGGVVVLKGGPTTVCGPGGVLSVARGGHPGMASAGMGDTLSGVLASLLGQGLSAWDAARVGVRLHALAGELAAVQYGYGLDASDVADRLGQSWQQLAGQQLAGQAGSAVLTSPSE